MTNEMLEVQRYERRQMPSLRDLAAIVFRQRWTMLATFVAVVLAVLLSGVWTRKYAAHMKILVLRQRMDAAVSAEPNAPAQVTPDITEEDLNSEVELIRSEDVLRKVVTAMGLQHRGWSLFGHRNDEIDMAKAVRKLGSDLDIEPVRKTDVIAVSYRSSDRELAASVLNAVAADYLEKHQEVHRPSGELAFFDQQAEQFRHGLEQTQAQLTEFTQKNGVVSAQLERDLTLQHLADFDATAHQAQASAAEVEQRINSLHVQLSAMLPRIKTEVKNVENQSLMQQLKSTLLNLELKRTELLTKYDPSYRLVKEVDKQIADTSAAIAFEQSHPATEETTNQDPTYEMLRSELARAEEELSGLKARAASTRLVADAYRNTAERLEQQGLQQYDMEQTAKTEEDNYLLYQRKREEARISDALDQRGILNVALAERPVVPALPVQSPVKTAGLTLLLGFFASLGTAFVRDYASPSFRTPDEVAGYLDMPVLATLPKSADEQ